MVKRTNTALITLTNSVVDRPWVFWVVGSNPTMHGNTWYTFSDFPHVELEKHSPVTPGNETASILKGPPVYPADLLSRRFRGGECYEAQFGSAIG